MPVAGWVSIGVAIFGSVWTVFWWLVRKRSEEFAARLTSLEAAVSGDNGIRSKMMGLVTSDALEARMVGMSTQLAAVKEEGEQREERILNAIGTSSAALGQTLSDVRADIRSQAQRIDAIFRRGD